MTTVDEVLKDAIQRNDAPKVGEVVDFLRERGSNYPSIYQRAKALTGISLAAWDTILEDSEIST
jgi:hypothetical protein